MKNIKKIGKGVGIFILMIILFMIFQFVSYALPNTKIRENIGKSQDLFSGEFYETPFYGNYGSLSMSNKQDNYTDAIILGVALDKYENLGSKLSERAVRNGWYYDVNIEPVQSLKESIKDETKANWEYTRYWFGSATFIRPLLMFMNLGQIRYLNLFIVIGVTLVTLYLLSKKLGVKYSIAFAISMFFIGIVVIPMSIQFLPVYLIMNCAMIAILTLCENKKFKNFLPYIFLITGMLTSYFDLLTYPLVTVGIPVIITLLLKNKKEEDYGFKEMLIDVIKYFIIWGIAYGATYFIKWVISSAILKQNLVKKSWNQFLYRADSKGELPVSKFMVIEQNMKVYFNKFAIICLIIYFATYLVIFIKNRENRNINFKLLLGLLIVAITPYIWYILLSNHSYVHSWMTYRIQAITMMAILCGIASCIKTNKKGTKNG